ncbi:MAG: hypothetical protein IT178_18020 [Acidobacteria bacterium]|nr:hypothetical protein [Acidobacteriota bacterium]
MAGFGVSQRPADRRAFIVVLLGALVITASARYGMSLATASADGSEHVLSLYRAARPSLPARGPVVFLQAPADDAAAAEMRFLAQLALAPLVLTSDATGARVAISTPNFPADRDAAIQSAGWRATAMLHGGIRIYAR